MIIILNLIFNYFYLFIRNAHYVQHYCTVGQKKEKKKKHFYLFQYKLSYRNETSANHHG